ncbi:MAG: hypothetical protein H0U72_05025 [Nitrosospira sp.]|nr:hypothetical protein [Nitrosospira sp.]
MKELIKRPSERPLVHARNYEPGVALAYDVMKGDTYALRTDSESMQVTIEEVSNDQVKVRIDSFETSVNAEHNGYRQGDSFSVSRDYLWLQEDSIGKTDG